MKINQFPTTITSLAVSLVLCLSCSKNTESSNSSLELNQGQLASLAAADMNSGARPVLQKDRKFKLIHLENGIDALMVEDAKAAKSGIGVDVAVGSLANPPEHKGLAHYIEHLLFLGSEKYPTAGDFDKFVNANGGWSNAYTADTRTNYQLEINTSALSEAVDRFSHFFIDPTFNEALMATELKNVDSEYQKNRESTVWRQQYLREFLGNPKHQIKNTFQGDNESLKNVTR